MHFASQEKTHRLNFQPPALCFFHLNTFLQGNLYFSFSNNRLTPALASQNWTILSSFATKLNNQNHSIMINKAQEQLIRNVQFRLIKTIQILKPLLHKIGQFRNLSEKFLYKRWPFLCLGGAHFCFHWKLCFSSFKLFIWYSFSFSAPLHEFLSILLAMVGSEVTLNFLLTPPWTNARHLYEFLELRHFPGGTRRSHEGLLSSKISHIFS